MSTSFEDYEGFPHPETTIVELERIAEEPADGFGRAVRGAYFQYCLDCGGTLSVFFPKDAPRFMRRFHEADRYDRGRLLPALLNVLPGLTLADLTGRIYVC